MLYVSGSLSQAGFPPQTYAPGGQDSVCPLGMEAELHTVGAGGGGGADVPRECSGLGVLRALRKVTPPLGAMLVSKAIARVSTVMFRFPCLPGIPHPLVSLLVS